MSGPVQVIAPGLLGFLQLKTLGRNPENFSDTIVPTMDVRTWYMEARHQLVTQAAINLGAGPFNGFQAASSFVVPNNEYWWVQNVTFSVGSAISGAADVMHWCVAMQFPQISNNPIMVEPNLIQTNGQGTTPICSAEGFFAPSGATLGFFLNRYAVALGVSVVGLMRVTKLPL